MDKCFNCGRFRVWRIKCPYCGWSRAHDTQRILWDKKGEKYYKIPEWVYQYIRGLILVREEV
ncbi:MAG: hypothetical protein A4E26_00066 [Methanobacterium sp. PtaU1.Bin097]|nr:MAG: hypothetical protein A4E26_00066 [Methanobacterium sp. PtaU1.Bin097]